MLTNAVLRTLATLSDSQTEKASKLLIALLSLDALHQDGHIGSGMDSLFVLTACSSDARTKHTFSLKSLVPGEPEN